MQQQRPSTANNKIRRKQKEMLSDGEHSAEKKAGDRTALGAAPSAEEAALQEAALQETSGGELPEGS